MSVNIKCKWYRQKSTATFLLSFSRSTACQTLRTLLSHTLSSLVREQINLRHPTQPDMARLCTAAAAAAESLQSWPSLRPHRRQPTRLPRPWDSPGKNTGVGCHLLLQCLKVKSEREVTQSRPTLSNPMDCSLPGSSVHGIFQAKSTGVDCHFLLHVFAQLITIIWDICLLLLLGISVFQLNNAQRSCQNSKSSILANAQPIDMRTTGLSTWWRRSV